MGASCYGKIISWKNVVASTPRFAASEQSGLDVLQAVCPLRCHHKW